MPWGRAPQPLLSPGLLGKDLDFLHRISPPSPPATQVPSSSGSQVLQVAVFCLVFPAFLPFLPFPNHPSCLCLLLLSSSPQKDSLALLVAASPLALGTPGRQSSLAPAPPILPQGCGPFSGVPLHLFTVLINLNPTPTPSHSSSRSEGDLSILFCFDIQPLQPQTSPSSPGQPCPGASLWFTISFLLPHPGL